MSISTVERVRQMIAHHRTTVPLVVRVHSVADDFSNLTKVPGIGLYSHRAVMMPGVAIIADDGNLATRQWVADMQRSRLGATEVIWVKEIEGSLYKAVPEHDTAVAVIYEVLKAGGQLEIFCSSIQGRRFQKRLGRALKLCYDFDFTEQHTASPHHKVARHWNDKVRMRLTAGNDLKHLFPEYELCPGMIDKPVQRLSDLGGYVVKLSPNKASTEGMLFLDRGETPPWDNLGSRNRKEAPAIVDQFHDHVPVSLTYEVHNGELRFLWASLQKMEGHAPGTFITMRMIKELGKPPPHQGNFVGSLGVDLGPNFTDNDIMRAKWEMLPIAEMIAERLIGKSHRYNGRFNLDLAKLRDGSYRVLECNARVSHSAYVASVLGAVEDRFIDGKAVVYIGNVNNVHLDVADYRVARRWFTEGEDPLLYIDGGVEGAQLYHTALLPAVIGKGEDAHRKCGVIAIGENFDSVDRLRVRAEMCLEGVVRDDSQHDGSSTITYAEGNKAN